MKSKDVVEINPVPFTEFNPAAGTLYWYKPMFKRTVGADLDWSMSMPTYNTQTHERGVERYRINFSDYGVNNRVLARALIALPQMHLVSLVGFRELLESPKSIDRVGKQEDDPLSELISSLRQHPRGEAELKIPGILTGALIDQVMEKVSVIDIFSLASKAHDSEKGLMLIDSFVGFYNGSRKFVVQEALERAKQKNYKMTVPNVRFEKMVLLLQAFAAAYSVASDSLNTESDVFTIPQSKKDVIWEIFQKEVGSGIRFIEDNETLSSRKVSTQNMVTFWRQLNHYENYGEKEELVLQDLYGNLIEKHGEKRKEPYQYDRIDRCPFFQQGFNEP